MSKAIINIIINSISSIADYNSRIKGSPGSPEIKRPQQVFDSLPHAQSTLLIV